MTAAFFSAMLTGQSYKFGTGRYSTVYFSFAPMEGLTSSIFRQTHARFFPGVDRYYAPFLAPDGQGKVKRSAL